MSPNSTVTYVIYQLMTGRSTLAKKTDDFKLHFNLPLQAFILNFKYAYMP